MIFVKQLKTQEEALDFIKEKTEYINTNISTLANILLSYNIKVEFMNNFELFYLTYRIGILKIKKVYRVYFRLLDKTNEHLFKIRAFKLIGYKKPKKDHILGKPGIKIGLEKDISDCSLLLESNFLPYIAIEIIKEMENKK